MSAGELLAYAMGGLLLGLAAVVVIDGGLALLGLGTFGRASGWLAAILPAWLFLEDVRAWRGARFRLVVAIGAALVALLLGLLAAAPASFLPPLGSGAVGAAVAVLGYAVLWFYGVRRLP